LYILHCTLYIASPPSELMNSSNEVDENSGYHCSGLVSTSIKLLYKCRYLAANFCFRFPYGQNLLRRFFLAIIFCPHAKRNRNWEVRVFHVNSTVFWSYFGEESRHIFYEFLRNGIEIGKPEYFISIQQFFGATFLKKVCTFLQFFIWDWVGGLRKISRERT
jgi:hypothetical protein